MDQVAEVDKETLVTLDQVAELPDLVVVLWDLMVVQVVTKE